jgi:hypothetical protein
MAVTYAIMGEGQTFEFKVLMPLQIDFNAAEAHARSKLDRFAKDLSSACQSNPLVGQVASGQRRPSP